MGRKADARFDRDAESDDTRGQLGPESAGQSGDAQGLPEGSEAADESVAELAEDDQSYEADVVDGVEDAGDHPEQPVRIREDRRPSHESELPPDPDWK